MICNLLKKEKSYFIDVRSIITYKIVFLTLNVKFSLLNSNFFKYINVNYAAEYLKIAKLKHFIHRIYLINNSLLQLI